MGYASRTMSNATSNPGPTQDASSSTVGAATPEGNGQALTAKEEAYAVALVECGNRSLAYRRAYQPSVSAKPGTIWSNASEVAQRPHVGARIRQLQEAAAAATVANKAQLIKFLWDRIMADRTELINHVRRCCRCCHGINHQHQWKDELEFTTTLDAWTKTVDPVDGSSKEPMPSAEGGFGFDPHREPDVTCTSAQCMGDGHGKTVIADTTKLVGSAALIYEGVKETAQGIEIKLADRNADIQQLSKLLGWSVDKVEGAFTGTRGPLPDAAYDIPSTSTPEEASRKYLALVS